MTVYKAGKTPVNLPEMKKRKRKKEKKAIELCTAFEKQKAHAYF